MPFSMADLPEVQGQENHDFSVGNIMLRFFKELLQSCVIIHFQENTGCPDMPPLKEAVARSCAYPSE